MAFGINWNIGKTKGFDPNNSLSQRLNDNTTHTNTRYTGEAESSQVEELLWQANT